MTYFRKIIDIADFPIRINHRDHISSIGSCFAVNIAGMLQTHKFEILSNPHGITYNPLSIVRTLTDVLEYHLYRPEDLIKNQGLFHSFHHHGDFSSPDPDKILSKINNQIISAHQFLKKTNWLIITLGTAHVFFHLDQQEVVNNCHKIPGTKFRRALLSVDQINKALRQILQSLTSFNPSCKIIFTISPVRHWRDGPIENNDSKATLRLGIRQLVQDLDQVYYFPSYEIMMDELRDYRFYADDMLHPNSLAIEYIWKKFQEHCMDEKTRQTNQKIAKVVTGMSHKPIRVTSPEHQRFLKEWKQKILALQLEYPYLNFEKELEKLQSQII